MNLPIFDLNLLDSVPVRIQQYLAEV